MSARTKARKRALDVLFECDLRGSDALDTLAQRLVQATPTVPEYTVTLVEGVVAHRERIDELIAAYAVGWTIDRMPAGRSQPVAHRHVRTCSGLTTCPTAWC